MLIRSVFLGILLLFIFACNDEWEEIEGCWEPTIPIKICINHKGEISTSANKAFITPIGKFSFGASLKNILNRSDRKGHESMLILKYKREKHVYKLKSKSQMIIKLEGEVDMTIQDHLFEIDVTDNSKLEITFIEKTDEIYPKGFDWVKYDARGTFREGLAKARKDEKWGFINRKDEIIIPFQFDFVYEFRNGEAIVRTDQNWRKINKKGDMITSFEFYHLFPFKDGLANVSKVHRKAPNCQWGMINMNGDIVIPLEFLEPLTFSSGLAVACKGLIYGYINKKGMIVVPFQFNGAKPFREGLAAVRKNIKWGYINKEGQVVIPFEFNDANTFQNGEATVEKNGKQIILKNPFDN